MQLQGKLQGTKAPPESLDMLRYGSSLCSTAVMPPAARFVEIVQKNAA